ncbi:cytochrome-c peroxidase [Sphingobacterium spiritivorum]|uniref:cytochrome-c peroxidase n=1 Tax=Sphingobacterium spiritivorum TaxID=258 RepID=UPI0021623051|nr:cytochrome c peroxidase [Sphingobacterium spiritivorum]
MRSLILAVTMLTVFSCQKDITLPEGTEEPFPTIYRLHAPAYFGVPVAMPDNPLTVQGVALGRRLFYDPLLSANMQVSCASCHHQDKAFADGAILSQAGVSGKPLTRHSPVLLNLAWADQGFFWDGGAKNLESQAFAPLTHADEMGMSLADIKARLRSDSEYSKLFYQAFGEAPSAEGTAKALAQFQRTLISADSRYDRYLRSGSKKELTEAEHRGRILVKQKCGNCHSGAHFTDYRFHNNGMDANFSDLSDEWIHLGRYRISLDPKDMGAYKTPTLRNVAVSAPYMHDGRFATLDQVLDHYRFGVKTSSFTDPVLYDFSGNIGISMTDKEEADIKAFLFALTDEQFLNNTRFSNPNKK